MCRRWKSQSSIEKLSDSPWIVRDAFDVQMAILRIAGCEQISRAPTPEMVGYICSIVIAIIMSRWVSLLYIESQFAKLSLFEASFEPQYLGVAKTWLNIWLWRHWVKVCQCLWDYRDSISLNIVRQSIPCSFLFVCHSIVSYIVLKEVLCLPLNFPPNKKIPST